jgi:hypothetical protein
MKGMTPINITVDDKGKQSQAMFCNRSVHNNKLRFLAKNIMGASTTEKLSDQFSISNIQLQMQLIKLPRKNKGALQ